MIILIDAYNVLKQVISTRITEQERMAFIKMLDRYRIKKKNEIIAVFDGGPARVPTIEKYHGVKIVYSGKDSADSYIMDYISNHKNLDLLLVSSDREVVSFASNTNVPALDGSSFYALLKATIGQTINGQEKKSVVVKTASSSEPSVDTLMEEASEHVENKLEEEPKERKSSSHSLTKQERFMQKKLKKL